MRLESYSMSENANIVNEIIKGRRLNREEALSYLLTEELNVLCAGANEIRMTFNGNKVDLCSIINGRSGRCAEDCRFCAQSAHHCANVEEYAFLPREEILSDCRKHAEQGVHRYSVVTSGRALTGTELEQALQAYKAMSGACRIKLCASHGLLSPEDFGRLREAGVSRYHANIETSRRNFPNVCTTHTYDDKIEVISRARGAGLSVCSGGIIGMGETWEDRIDMALDLADMEIQSIPLNVLQPIKGTPLEHMEPLNEEDILRSVAIFRYLNPEAQIRLAAGRNRMERSGERAFRSGANAAITGDMLTTSGNSITEDKRMLSGMGFEV